MWRQRGNNRGYIAAKPFMVTRLRLLHPSENRNSCEAICHWYPKDTETGPPQREKAHEQAGLPLQDPEWPCGSAGVPDGYRAVLSAYTWQQHKAETDCPALQNIGATYRTRSPQRPWPSGTLSLTVPHRRIPYCALGIAWHQPPAHNCKAPPSPLAIAVISVRYPDPVAGEPAGWSRWMISSCLDD